MDGEARGTWTQSLNNLAAHADAILRGTLGSNPAAPINGEVHADYTRATQQIELHQSYFRTSQTSVALDGKISGNSQLQVRMTSNDLHELELLAANLRTGAKADSAQAPLDLGLYGTGRLTASVGGSLDNPQIRGRLDAG